MKTTKFIPIICLLGAVFSLLWLNHDSLQAENNTIRFVAPTAQGAGDCSSWVNACTLVEALENTTPTVEIWVQAGVHKPISDNYILGSGALYGGFSGIETHLDERDPENNLTILSGDIDNNDITDPNGIITDTDHISGTNRSTVITLAGSSASMDGFIVTGGYAIPFGIGGGGVGGGMIIYGSPTLSNTTFIGNYATYKGGGLYLYEQANPIINAIYLTKNTARDGGGAYNERTSLGTYNNVTFDNNKATRYGGGLFSDEASPTLNDSLFTNNTAPSGGGMVNYGITSNFGQATLNNVLFTENSATQDGGGMWTLSDPPILNEVVFFNNSANRGGGMASRSTVVQGGYFFGNTASLGGGIASMNASSTFNNVVVSGNTANDGGGICISAATIQINNASIGYNEAITQGGGIYITNDSNTTINNTVLWENTASIGAQVFYSSTTDIPTILYSDIQGSNGSGTNWDTSIGIDGGGNLDIAPLFIDSDGDDNIIGTLDDNFNLQTNSPLVENGTNNQCPEHDIVNEPRPQDQDEDGIATCDIGAYEVDGLITLSIGFEREGSGIVSSDSFTCSPECEASFYYGEVVTLTAIADAGSTFRQWEGACQHRQQECVVTIDQPQVVTATFTNDAESILYVAPLAQGQSDCSNWDNACPLQQALSEAQRWEQIWVIGGEYKPSTNPSDRSANFTLIDEVEMYGGFAGTETMLSQRNLVGNPTVLSGDIDDNDMTDANGIITETGQLYVDATNSYNIVTSNGVTRTTILDGFILTGSSGGTGGSFFNTGGEPTINNVQFIGNYSTNHGAGFSNLSGGRPTLTNVTFRYNLVGHPSGATGAGLYNNTGHVTIRNGVFEQNSLGSPNRQGAGIYSINGDLLLENVLLVDNEADEGGGLFLSQSQATLNNVIFNRNIATNNGGGMYASGSTITINNTNFIDNSASNAGGGIYNASDTNMTLNNLIVWNNTASSNPQIANASGSTTTIQYSNIENSFGSGTNWDNTLGGDGGGNIDADPLFIDADGDDDVAGTLDDNFRLQEGSPAIDFGVNSACPTTDIEGRPRPIDGNNDLLATCDMGAYEMGDTYTLSVSIDGDEWGYVRIDDLDCLTDCEIVLGANAVVTLTAVTYPNSNFIGWGDACTGSSQTCTLMMSEAQTVTATFTNQQFAYLPVVIRP